MPAARVDEHLDGCADCRSWLANMKVQAEDLRRLAQRPVALRADARRPAIASPQMRVAWPRWALLGVGVLQVFVGAAQALGMNLGLSHGLSHGHGMESAGHLLNESTAWSITLGVVMIGAAAWPATAAGLATVLSVFVAVLTTYVVADVIAGAVTATRVLSHLPVVLGAVLAILLWRTSTGPRTEPRATSPEPDIVLPPEASRGRRRGHLWPTDGSAA